MDYYSQQNQQNQQVGQALAQAPKLASIGIPSTETVESALVSLANEVTTLQDAIQQLEVSMRPVLYHSDEGALGQVAAPSYQVAVLDSIHDQINRLRASTIQVNDLRSRNRI